jgi:hypothetical protein
MPSASAIGSSSPSGVRSRSEYSSCSAVTGAQPRKYAIVWACAATHAGTSEKPAEPTLGVVAQGAKETALNGRTFTYGAGQYLIVSVELP